MRPIKALRADGIPIGELSRLCGVNIETIRYYEKQDATRTAAHRSRSSGLWAKGNAHTRLYPPRAGAGVYTRPNPRLA